MHNYLYQITNLINNKIYIGVHKTDDLDDGYMGSGKIIKSAIEKYGIENFRKDILENFDTYENALAKEAEIVTDEFLQRDDVYNLRRGGTGGFDYINKIDGLNQKNHAEWNKSFGKIGLIGRLTQKTIAEQDTSYWPTICEKISTTKKGMPGTFAGRLHSRETKELIGKYSSINQLGNKNSQYGKCWITNHIENRKIYKTDLDSYIRQGWISGRKMNLSKKTDGG